MREAFSPRGPLSIAIPRLIAAGIEHAAKDRIGPQPLDRQRISFLLQQGADFLPASVPASVGQLIRAGAQCWERGFVRHRETCREAWGAAVFFSRR
jgi:hypothetical protein